MKFAAAILALLALAVYADAKRVPRCQRAIEAAFEALFAEFEAAQPRAKRALTWTTPSQLTLKRINDLVPPTRPATPALPQAIPLPSPVQLPQCDADGKYQRKQCDDNVCWCVSPRSGARKFSKGTIPLGEDYACEGRPTNCQKKRFAILVEAGGAQPRVKRAVSVTTPSQLTLPKPIDLAPPPPVVAVSEPVPSLLSPVQLPQCDADGKYNSKQCDANVCWCVRPRSGELKFSKVAIPLGEDYACEGRPTECQKKRFAILVADPQAYAPDCASA